MVPKGQQDSFYILGVAKSAIPRNLSFLSHQNLVAGEFQESRWNPIKGMLHILCKLHNMGQCPWIACNPRFNLEQPPSTLNVSKVSIVEGECHVVASFWGTISYKAGLLQIAYSAREKVGERVGSVTGLSLSSKLRLWPMPRVWAPAANHLNKLRIENYENKKK